MRALMREATQLKNNLPIHPNSSILVRQVRTIPLFSLHTVMILALFSWAGTHIQLNLIGSEQAKIFLFMKPLN